MRGTTAAAAAAALLAVGWPGSATWAAQTTMPVQGQIRDNAGELVVEGAFALDFALYVDPDTTQALWSESWPPDGVPCDSAPSPSGCVEVQEGAFTVLLGTHAPLSAALFADPAELWLGVAVEGEPELPRRPVGSVGRAFAAQHADVAGGLDCSDCVAASALAFDLCGEVAECGAGGVIVASDLPPDGLDEVSNGALTNQFGVASSSSEVPVQLPDFCPSVKSASIQIDDDGALQSVAVTVGIEHEDASQLVVTLYGPGGLQAVLHDGGAGTPGGLMKSWTDSDEPSLLPLLGTNPSGIWSLGVEDTQCGGGEPGWLTGFAVDYEVLRSGQVEVAGDLTVKGTVLGDLDVTGDVRVAGVLAGPTVPEPPFPCDMASQGGTYFNTSTTRMYVCSGTEWLRLSACSELELCKPASEVPCEQQVESNGCGDPCPPGVGLNEEQCLFEQYSPDELVEDNCTNICGYGTGVPGTEGNPGEDCAAILESSPSVPDGLYWIQPDPQQGAFQAYCDMTTDGGGWTLVARILAGSSDHKNGGVVGTLVSPVQPAVAKLSDAVINALRGSYSTSTLRLRCGATSAYFQENKPFDAESGGTAVITKTSYSAEGPFDLTGQAVSSYRGVSAWNAGQTEEQAILYGNSSVTGCDVPYNVNPDNADGTLFVR